MELAPRPERPRPDQERIAAAEAARREAARQRRDEEMQAAHVQDYAMDGTESEGAALAKRQPAPAGALWEAVRAQLEDQHAATPEVSGGAPRPVQKVRREIALEILAVAEHASRASSGRHAPPPRPEAIAEMAGAVQNRADRLIRHAAGKLGLDLPLASDRTAAAPADEQSPSAAETPAAPTATETPAATTAAAPDPSPYDNAAIIERPSAADWAPGGAAPPVQKDRRSSSRSRD